MKVLMIDVEHWENESTSHILQGIDDLADHIQGRYMNGIPEARFLKHKNVFHSNYDGKDMTFTIDLTLYNFWAVASISHSTVKHNVEGALWIQQFHILLGELAGRVMPLCMNEEYVNSASDERPHSTFLALEKNLTVRHSLPHLRSNAVPAHRALVERLEEFTQIVKIVLCLISCPLTYPWFETLQILNTFD